MFVFGDFSKKVRIWPKKDCVTDNIIFRLHYRFTFIFLMGCMVIVSSRQFIKEHINCISDGSVAAVINTFCFFSATFTVARYHNESYLKGTHIASPGVGPALPGEEIRQHAYYQWVPFVLFGQALLFYIPHYLWKSLEKGRISGIVNHVRCSPLTGEADMEVVGQKIHTDDTKRQREKWLKNVYITWCRFKVNRDWAKNLILCECLNALNIILQIYLVDSFLKGNFLDLGVRWLEDDEEVLESVFPKVTKCTFHKFGQSGSIQVHDAICVMSLNIINEKIYTILWFWFLTLFFVTVLGIVWRMLTFLLHRRSGAFNRLIWGEISPGPALKPDEIDMIASKLSFSDWLFLYYLGRNMDPRMFRRMVSDLSHSLGRSLLTLSESDKSGLANESFC